MSKPTIAIMGSGPLGLWTAANLAKNADLQLRLGNRQGKAPAWLPESLATADAAKRVTWLSLDALNAESVKKLAEGASALVHTANPLYFEWAEKLPIMQQNAIAAALAAHARLICADNLYAYAPPVSGPLTETTPENPPSRKGQIRKDMHILLRVAQAEQGLVWSTIQASDYFGPAASFQSTFGDRFIDPILKGKTARFIGNPDLRHSWAYAPDFGRALGLLATTDRLDLLNRSWILPHVSQLSANLMAKDFFGELAKQGLLSQLAHPKTAAIPRFLIKVLGIFNPLIREVDEMLYQFLMNFEASGEAFSQATGFKPTALATAIEQTVEFWQVTKKL